MRGQAFEVERKRGAVGTGALLAPFALLLAACATMSGAPTTPAPERYTVSGPGAERYTTEPGVGVALRGPHAFRVAEGLKQAEASHGVKLTPDARLAEIGRLVAEHEAKHGDMPPAAAIDLWTRHLGLFEPTPKIALLKTGDANGLAQQAAEYAVRVAHTEHATHVGAYTAEDGPGVVLVMVASERRARIDPVAREQPPDTSVVLRGELAAGLQGAQLITTDPSGASHRVQEATGSAFAFDEKLRARGEHRVEIVASSAAGVVVVANFPVYVGVPARTEVIAAARETGTASSAEAVKQRLFELLNTERERAGAPKLEQLEALERIALAHSEDMRDHDFVAHTSPTTGGPEQRLQRAGLRVAPLRENIGRDDSAEGIHRGLMESPGHRDNILGRDVSHVGIGVTEVHQGGTRLFLATELFARIPKRLDAAADREAFLQAMQSARAQRSLPELPHDAVLSELCDDAARTYFTAAQPADRALLEGLTRAANKRGLPYKRLAALMTVVTAAPDAATIDALLDPKARAVGVGFSQGTRPTTVDDAIAVVILVGY